MSRPIFTSAAEVEAAFYDALARADISAMMTLWSEDEDVVCIRPDEPRTVGLAAIRESWRKLFSSGPRRIARASHQVVSANMMLTVHNVCEYASTGDADASAPPVIATNVYTRGALGWRMVMHHASEIPGEDQPLMHLAPHAVH